MRRNRLGNGRPAGKQVNHTIVRRISRKFATVAHQIGPCENMLPQILAIGPIRQGREQILVNLLGREPKIG